jgi:hypothetical protein
MPRRVGGILGRSTEVESHPAQFPATAPPFVVFTALWRPKGYAIDGASGTAGYRISRAQCRRFRRTRVARSGARGGRSHALFPRKWADPRAPRQDRRLIKEGDASQYSIRRRTKPRSTASAPTCSGRERHLPTRRANWTAIKSCSQKTSSPKLAWKAASQARIKPRQKCSHLNPRWSEGSSISVTRCYALLLMSARSLRRSKKSSRSNQSCA